MIDRRSLDELYDYTTFTWATYGNALRTLPPDAIARPVAGSGWPALRDVLFHLACGWDNWLRDRLGLDDPLDATADSITSWADAQALRGRTRGWLRRVLDETSDAGMYDRIEQVGSGGDGGLRVGVVEVLSHILLHERGHHGDVTTLLSQLGAAPAASDYLVYVFFRDRAGAR